MTYSMEAEVEAERLEEQIHQSNYSLKEELANFEFHKNEVILDAGCGTGVLARYLADNLQAKEVDGFDFSELRIMQAKKLNAGASKAKINFYQQDLSRIDKKFYGKYDTVICRYVLEHVENPIMILKELKKTLKPGGRLIVYDLDGVFVNLHSENKKFNEYMQKIKTVSTTHFDLHIGRKLPAYFKAAGLDAIRWDAKLLCCQGRSLNEEKTNTEKRFVALAGFLTNFFGSAVKYEEFRDLYLQEMSKEENTLVFTKYVCSGQVR